MKLYIAGLQGSKDGLNTEVALVSREASASVLRPVTHSNRAFAGGYPVSINGRIREGWMDHAGRRTLVLIPGSPDNGATREGTRIPTAPGVYLFHGR